jgi:hypothetical protein
MTVHDIRDYGAAVDGQTDDTEAVRAALDATQSGDTVFFPAGVTLVGRGYKRAIRVTASHSGVTLSGTGENSVIKMAGGHSERNQVIYIKGSTDPSDITVENLRIDGNRSNNAHRTTQGLLVWPNGSTSNINVRNVWIDNCSASAFKTTCPDVTVEYSTARNNGHIGFATDVLGETSNPSRIRNVLATGCRQGIDASGGDTIIDGFVIENCTFGMKNTAATTSCDIRHGVFRDCDDVGYRLNAPDPPATPAEISMDQVVSEGNGDWAFRFDANGNFNVGTIEARNCNRAGDSNGQIGFLNAPAVTATEIRSFDSGSGSGIFFTADRDSSINLYRHSGNPGGAVDYWTPGGALTIDSSETVAPSAVTPLNIPTKTMVGAGVDPTADDPPTDDPPAETPDTGAIGDVLSTVAVGYLLDRWLRR